MPHYPVLQPDWQLAIYSTEVEAAIMFDLTLDEAIAEMERWHGTGYRKYVEMVQGGHIPFDYWDDWDHCLAWAMYMHGQDDETVRMMLDRTPDNGEAARCLVAIYESEEE